MTQESANQLALGHDVFVSYASQDVADLAATASCVVTQFHVPGRRGPIHGACGKNLLFFTLRLMELRGYTKETSTRFTFPPKIPLTVSATRCCT